MQRGLWQRIKRVALTDVRVLVTGPDRETLAAIERVLVEADFGSAAMELTQQLEEELRRGRMRTEVQVRQWLAEKIQGYMPDQAVRALNLGDGTGVGVVLVFGVNGVGKTTTAAKLAAMLQRSGKEVVLAAADTYRAGASEQLREWASRLEVHCVTGGPGADPASVAFDAVDAGRARHADAVIVDTAGRLHTHGDLMQELQKVVRVVRRKGQGAPHESLLVLDATVGQNALQQGRAFAASVPITGLVLTKLDGTAKGGSVLRVRHELGIPIRYVGVGEQLADLEPFDPVAFTQALLAE